MKRRTSGQKKEKCSPDDHTEKLKSNLLCVEMKFWGKQRRHLNSHENRGKSENQGVAYQGYQHSWASDQLEGLIDLAQRERAWNQSLKYSRLRSIFHHGATGIQRADCLFREDEVHEE